jgi:hypothetical protein
MSTTTEARRCVAHIRNLLRDSNQQLKASGALEHAGRQIRDLDRLIELEKARVSTDAHAHVEALIGTQLADAVGKSAVKAMIDNAPCVAAARLLCAPAPGEGEPKDLTLAIRHRAIRLEAGLAALEKLQRFKADDAATWQ